MSRDQLRQLSRIAFIGYEILVVGFAIYMGWLFFVQAQHMIAPTSNSFGPLWEGETVTLPLGVMMNIVLPVGILALIVSVAVRDKTDLRAIRRIQYGLAVLAITAGLLIGFGHWVWSFWLAGAGSLTGQTWWLLFMT